MISFICCKFVLKVYRTEAKCKAIRMLLFLERFRDEF